MVSGPINIQGGDFTFCNIFIFFEGEAKVLSSSSDESASEEDTYGIGVHDGKFSGRIAKLAGVCSAGFVDEGGE